MGRVLSSFRTTTGSAARLAAIVGLISGGVALGPLTVAVADDFNMITNTTSAATGTTIEVTGTGCTGEVLLTVIRLDMVLTETVDPAEDGTWSTVVTQGSEGLGIRATCSDYLDVREYRPVTVVNPEWFEDATMEVRGSGQVGEDAVVAGLPFTVEGTDCAYPSMIGSTARPVFLSIDGGPDVTVVPTNEGTWSYTATVDSATDGTVTVEAYCGSGPVYFDYRSVELPFLARPTLAVDRSTIRAGETFTVSGTGCVTIGSAAKLTWPVQISINDVTTSVTAPTARPDGTWSLSTSVSSASGNSLRIVATCAVGSVPLLLDAEVVVPFAQAPRLSDTGVDPLSVVIGGTLVLVVGAALVLSARRRTT